MKTVLQRWLGAMALAAISLGGWSCGSKPEAPAPATQPKTGVSIEGEKNPAPAAATDTTSTTQAAAAPDDDPPSLQGPGTMPTPEVMLRSLEKFAQKFGRYPTSTDEMISKGYLNSLPPLPPGKKYRINTQAGTIEVN